MTSFTIRFLAMLVLSGGSAFGASDIPSHIVQPLPRQLDPQFEPPFQPPADIVRPLTAEETAQREKDLAPVPSAPLLEAGLNAMASQDAQDREADEEIRGFRQQHNVSIQATAADTQQADSGNEEKIQKPSAKKADDELYHINCDEGVYFDMRQGLLVYMKNVRIRNPHLSLDCDGPLKIYLEYREKNGQKKPSERRKNEGKEKSELALPGGGNFDFNSIKKVSASGNVVVHYTDKKGESTTAQAEKITYDATTGEIILSGNYPFVKIGSGNYMAKAPEKDGFIRVYGNGDIYVSRGGETILRNVDKQFSDRKKQKTNRKP